MPLSDRYILPSQATLDARRRITAATLVLPWDKDEKEAREFNAKIEAAYRRCQEPAAVLKRAKVCVIRNLTAIAKALNIEYTTPFREEKADAIEARIWDNPMALVNGLEDELGGLENLVYGKAAVNGLVHILREHRRTAFPMLCDPYFRMLQDLDEYQVMSIDNDHLVVIVVAGAGGGKTRVVVWWVVTRIRTGTPPERVLCLSFSDDAMREMKSRIQSISPQINVLTFHAFALKSLSQNVGLLRDVRVTNVIDEVQQLHILRKIVNLQNARIGAEDMVALIQRYTLEAKRAEDDPDLTETQRRILAAYVQEKQKRKALDFSDMILRFHRALHECPEFRKKVSDSYDVIALDEAQDSFSIFIDCLRLIRNNQQMLIVGDPSQRIYTFAGSTTNAFKEIQEKIGGEIMVLPYNHRSHPVLVRSMDAFIRTNSREIIRPVIAARKE